LQNDATPFTCRVHGTLSPYISLFTQPICLFISNAAMTVVQEDNQKRTTLRPFNMWWNNKPQRGTYYSAYLACWPSTLTIKKPPQLHQILYKRPRTLIQYLITRENALNSSQNTVNCRIKVFKKTQSDSRVRE